MAFESLKTLRAVASFAGEVVSETLWPTRCALCDRPQLLLCPDCEGSLPFIDLWRACPYCGAAYGLCQCDQCNPVVLGSIDRRQLPFAGCASAVIFNAETGHLVRTFKDNGEQRLAKVFAAMMARSMPKGWPISAVGFIPASASAYRQRGFDHGKLLGEAVAAELSLPLVSAFQRPRTKDQRRLSAMDRKRNLASRFSLMSDLSLPSQMLLVDDVLTTGATLGAAADTLLAAGVEAVYGLTFARV